MGPTNPQQNNSGLPTDSPATGTQPSQSNPYQVEYLEVQDPRTSPGVYNAPVKVEQPTMRSVPFSKKKALTVSLVITGIVGVFTASSILILSRRDAGNRIVSPTTSVPVQDIDIKNPEEIAQAPELQGDGESLLVNGNIISKGTLQVVSGDFLAIFQTSDLTDNRTYTLPDSSGSLCLDSNNCQFATAAQLTQLQAGIGASAGGVRSFQGQTGAVTLTAGDGIGISGTTITNNGVRSLVSGSAGLTVANDGSGNLTISEVGSGSPSKVLLGPSAVQDDTSNNPSIHITKTGSGNLLQLATGSTPTDRFVVDQTGAITTGTISFGQITSVPSIVNTIAGASGTILLGTGLQISGSTINNTGVTAITGTANQVIASGSTGSVSLSLPQDIHTAATPTFGGLTLTTALPVTSGGTGANTAGGARTNLGAAASGANSDITSLSGLTTALSVIQGGTGVNVPGTTLGGATLIYNTTLDRFEANRFTSSDGRVVFTFSDGNIDFAVPAAGQCSLCADRTLNNLVGVAINTSLLPQSAGAIDLGAATIPFRDLFLSGTSATPGSNNFKITGVASGGVRTITLPDASGTVCLDSNNCGYQTAGSYVNIQATTPGTAQTGHINITGTIIAGNIQGSIAGVDIIENADGFQITGGTSTARTLNVSGGNVSLNQNLLTTSNATFNQLSLANALTVGNGGTGLNATPTNGQLLIGNGTGFSFNTLANGDGTIVITNGSGTISLSAPNAGSCSTCATTSLSNIGSVSIPTNAHLLPSAAAGIDIGSGSRPIRDLYLAGTSGTPGTNNFKITGVSTSGTRTLTLADLTGTVALVQTAGSSMQQTGDINVSGAFIAPRLQTADQTVASTSSVNLTIRSGNATGATSNSGNVIVDSGTATTTAGTVTIGGTNATALTLGRSGLQVGLPGGLTTSNSAISTGSGLINSQTISSTANFTGSLTIQGASSLTLGVASTATGAALFKNATNAQTITLQSGATDNGGGTSVTLTLPTTDGANGDCLKSDGSGVLSFSGCAAGLTATGTPTTGAIAKFTSASSLGDSIISESGSVITIGGTLAVNTIDPTSTLTIGDTTNNLVLQGGSGTKLEATASGITNSLVFATPASTNKTITIPNATGTIAVSASSPITLSATGDIACPTCGVSGSGISSLNGLSGNVIIEDVDGTDFGTSGNNIQIRDGSTSVKGIASFNSTNFSSSGGAINTIQNINTTATPTFNALTLSTGTTGLSVTGAPTNSATASLVRIGNAIASGDTTTNGGTYIGLNAPSSGAGSAADFLNLQLNGVSKLKVNNAGNITGGEYNGLVLAEAANQFTVQGGTGTARTLTVSGDSTINQDLSTTSNTVQFGKISGLTTKLEASQGGTGSDLSAALAGAIPIFNSSTGKFAANRITSTGSSVTVTSIDGAVNLEVASCTTCANTSLSNLSGVAIQGSSLLTGAASIDLGSATAAFKDLYLYGSGTYGSHSLKLTGTPTGNRVLTLPDATATLCASNNNCDYEPNGTFVNLQASSPGSAQSGHLNITGNILAAQYDGLDLQENATGFQVEGGSSTSRTLTVTASATINQSLQTTDSVTFNNLDVDGNLTVDGTSTLTGAVTTTTIKPVTGGDITLGTLSASEDTTVQGITLTLKNADDVYSFTNPGGAASYNICTSVGNCASVGGGVTTPGGVTGRFARFTNTQEIDDSTILFEDTGKIGIGTGFSPSAIVHITDAGGGTALFKITDSTATARDVFDIADGGAATFRNQTNSTTALRILNAVGDVNLFTADTSNAVIKVGTTASPTLSGAVLLAGASEISGALRVGDSTHRAEFDATNHQLRFSGNSRNTRRIRLTGEYPNSVLDGDGTSNLGTLTSGYDSTARQNYFKWTTTQASAQDYDIVVQVPIPSDFDGWAASNPMAISVFNSNATNTDITLAVTDNSGTVGSTQNIGHTSASTWATKNPTISGSFSASDAGGYFVLRLHLTSPTSGDIRIGNISFDYLSKF